MGNPEVRHFEQDFTNGVRLSLFLPHPVNRDGSPLERGLSTPGCLVCCKGS